MIDELLARFNAAQAHYKAFPSAENLAACQSATRSVHDHMLTLDAGIIKTRCVYQCMARDTNRPSACAPCTSRQE